MPIDLEFIGREYKPVVYVIGQEKIKEYALAIGDLNPLYTNPEYAKSSKYKTVIAHPMFIVVYAKEAMDNLFQDKELNLNMKRLLHGEQEFNFHKIVKSNDTITTNSKIKTVYEKANNDFVVLETKSYNQDKELVSEGIWTFVIRG